MSARNKKSRRGIKNLRPGAVAKALHEACGLVSLAAQLLGCSDEAVYGQIRRHPKVEEAARLATERELDAAESKLFEAIKKGESWAITFFLARKGKTRGYSERSEFTGKNGARLTVMDLVLDDSKD